MNFHYQKSPLFIGLQKKPTFSTSLKKLLWLLCLLFPLVGHSTDYYFSTSTGNDNRSITEAQNPATPWKTIDKLNAVASSLKGGDRVLFAAGEVFYGTIHIVKGGDTGNPVVYTTYGTGSPAIITSLEDVTDWRSTGGGKYEASLPNLESSVIQIVEVDGVPKEIGRYPNTNSESPFLDIVSINGPNSLTGQPNSLDFTGGEIVIRKNNWIIDRHPITSTSGSIINYGTVNTAYDAKVGYGYFIQNHVNTLDATGEWAYNSSLKTITAYTGATRSSDVTIKVAQKDFLVTNQPYIKNISFVNLHFKGANKAVFQIKQSGNFKIENCTVESSGEDGIYMEQVPDLTITNNTIRNNYNSGVFVYYGSPRVSIINNLVENSMPYQGMSQSSDMNGIGIFINSDSDNSIIENNRVINTGYNGIHFGGDYTIIKNNFIENFCAYKQDGGGIYTNSDGQTNRNNTGREIANNILIKGIGNIDGNEEKVLLANGIYLDDVAAGIKVYGNTINEVTANGIYLHNNNDVEITDNLEYKVKTQILATHDPIGTAIRDITIENNQLSRIFDDEIVIDFNSINYDLTEFGIVDNNYFLDPYNNDFIFYSRDPGDGPTGQTRNLQSWRDALDYDLNSKKPRFNLQRYEVITSEPIKSSTFDSNIDIVAGTYGGESEWVSDGITGGSLSITPNPGADVLTYIQIGAVEAGEEILIEFDAKSSTENKEIQLFLEKTYDDNQEGTLRYFPTSLEPEKVQVHFDANVSASNESIVIKITDPSNPVIFDNMTISRVTTKELDIMEFMFFDYNYSDEEITLPLPGVYRNAKNEIFNQEVTIPPYKSVLLVKTQFQLPDLPPSPIEIAITTPTPNQEFYSDDDVFIDTDISDPTGLLDKVYIYAGDSVIARIYDPPYQYTWTNAIIPGPYNLKAVAFDKVGRTSESELVPILVRAGSIPNIPPTVEITYPSDNQNIDLGNDVLITTEPDDEDGTIDRVEIYVDGNLIGTVNQAPYQVNWTPIVIDSYTLSAIVYDTEGAMGSSQTITVNITEPPTPNQPPSIQVIDPVEGQNLLFGQPIQIITDPEDPENDIDRVEFYTGTQLIGTTATAPFNFTWTDAASGQQAIKSIIYDHEGLMAESDAVNINVIDTSMVNFPPVIILEEPIRESVIGTGALLKILATIYDPENDVERVEFYAGDDLLGFIESDPFEFDWAVQLEVGTYLVYAIAYDGGGNSTQSQNVIVHVIPASEVNLPPTISISQPSQGENYNYGETIMIKTNPYDPENEIRRVAIFADGELLTLLNEAPYDYDWSQIPIGTHELYAVVTDREGQMGESETIEFNVTNEPPTIAITEPVDGQIFTPGEDVLIKTEPMDPENEIDHVSFFSNDEILAIVTEAPYEFNWISPPNGTYTLKTKVTDAYGLTAESARPTIQIRENLPPTISITLPSQGQEYNYAEQVLIKTSPIDAENGIEKVEIFADGALLAEISEAPYEYEWEDVPMGYPHKIYAVVTDNDGQMGYSGEIEFSVSNFAPTITLIRPVDGRGFSLGQDVLIRAVPIDPEDEIEKVEFFANDLLIATVTQAPYEFNWMSPIEGPHTIKAIGYDIYGLTGESEVASIVVSSENLPPTIVLTEPLNGQVFNLGEDVLIVTEPVDPEGEIEKVEFFANDELLATVTQAPFEFNWNSPTAGSHTLRAMVYDTSGQTGESQNASILVRLNLPPTISIIQPTQGQEFNYAERVLITTNPDDPENEIEKVEIFADGALLAELMQAPYEYEWSDVPVGYPHRIYAVVTDTDGLRGYSEEIEFTVLNFAPTITLVEPVDGQEFNLGDDALIKAEPVDPEDDIQKVEFYATGVLIATVRLAPYEFNWVSPPAGSYSVKAMVYDAFGLTGESEVANIVVRENLPPTIALVEPEDGQVFNLGEDVLIVTEPIDPEGEIEKVEFFANDELLATVTEAPFEFNWNSPAEGTHTLRAMVYDISGQTGESQTTSIVIRSNLPPTVSITQPGSGQEFNYAEQVLIRTNPVDPENEIEKVEIFADGALLAELMQAPYEYEWSDVPMGYPHKIYAVVTDNGGLKGYSGEVEFNVLNFAPTITLVEPVDGQILSAGEDVLIKTEPADPEDEIQKVEFFVDDELLATVTGAPYEFNWANPAEGSHVLRATVYDVFDLTGESEVVNIVIGENLPPTISIIQPNPGQVYPYVQPVLIETDPFDAEDQIEHVEIFVDGALLAQIDRAPYEYEWSNVPTGYPHKVYAVVTDRSGQVGFSEEIEFTMLNFAPSVSLAYPVNGQVFNLGENVLITSEPNDPEGEIQKVEFFANGVLIATVTNAPYEFNLENLPVGTYTLKTKVFDVTGLTAESSKSTIRVVRNANLGWDFEQPRVLAIPNPAINFVILHLFNLHQVENLSVEVVDMQGNHVDTISLDKGTERVKLDVSSYTPGIYLFRIVGDNNIMIIKKVIKL